MMKKQIIYINLFIVLSSIKNTQARANTRGGGALEGRGTTPTPCAAIKTKSTLS